MPLHELLSTDRIAILTSVGDRGAVIDAAARLLAGRVAPAATIRAIGDSLREREQLASTAIGHGVAIPHGRIRTGHEISTDGSSGDKIRGAFLRLREPVDFGALDGEPVDLVLAMAVPEHAVQQHLQQLAELAERFADPDFRAALRQADSVAALGRCLFASDRATTH